MKYLVFILLLSAACTRPQNISRKNIIYKDSTVYRIDTIVQKVYIYHYVDTVKTKQSSSTIIAKKKLKIDPSNLGIGPSLGAYYSPFNGFDILIGFGIQYYFMSIPMIKKPSFHNKVNHHK